MIGHLLSPRFCQAEVKAKEKRRDGRFVGVSRRRRPKVLDFPYRTALTAVAAAAAAAEQTDGQRELVWLCLTCRRRPAPNGKHGLGQTDAAAV